MKKFFAFLMFAAALMTGCDDPKKEDGPDPDEEEFYGMTMNSAEVLNRGDYYGDGTNSYIITMYKMEGQAASRILVAEIVTPEVNDGVVPAGKYTIADGNLAEGAFTGIIEGSHFIRNTEADGYIMLVTDGSLEVKHLEGGQYELTASFKGVNAVSGESVTPTDNRFTGVPTMTGLPANNNYTVFTPVGCQVQYASNGDGTAYYDIVLFDKGATEQGSTTYTLAEYYLLAEDNGQVLPQGTFVVDPYGMGAPNTILGAGIFGEDNGKEIKELCYYGSITIKAQGEGKYNVEGVLFGANAGYKQRYSGTTYFIEESAGTELNIDAAVGYYGGVWNDAGETYWTLIMGDEANDTLLYLYVNTSAESNMETGIPSGTYTIGNNSAVGTIDVGWVDEDGYANGSMIMDYNMTGVYDLPTSGEMTVVNNGDGTYTIDFEFGTYKGETFFGAFAGELPLVDDTEEGGGGGGGDLQEIPLNFDFAQMGFYGLGEWVLFIGDSKNDAVLMLDTFQAEDATFADGLESGIYTFAETYEPCTIWPGYVDEDGAGGSLVLTLDMSGYYDIVNDGALIVENLGDGNYAFEVEMAGERYIITGIYEGEVVAEDLTAEQVAPKKVAKKAAPLKENIAPAKASKKAAPAMKMSATKIQSNIQLKSVLNF